MPTDPLLIEYAAHTEATPTDITRLRAHVRSAHRQPRRIGLPALLGMAALAAAALIVTGLTDTEPASLAASFDASQPGPLKVAPGVTLTADGTGTLTGTETAPRLAWSSGRVEFSVEPGAGLDVQVHTEEARVQVVGTVFHVERGPLGTEVGVRRGTVAVGCETGERYTLNAGQTATCLPKTASGLLGRAQVQRTAGVPTTDILATVQRGLAASPDSTIRTELSALQVALHVEGGAPETAIAAAKAHLDEAENGRRAEVARIGAALGYAASGCEGAAPFLADLPRAEIAASALSVCQSAGEATPSR